MLQLGGLLNSFGNGLVLPVPDHLPAQRARHLAGAGGADRGHEQRRQPGCGAGLRAAHRPLRRAGRCCASRSASWRPGSAATRSSTTPGRASSAPPWPGSETAASGPPSRPCWRPSRRSKSGPTVYAFQRMMMNLGIGLGGVVAGLIANTSDPSSFTWLFLGDAATFVGYTFVLSLVPEPGPPPAAAAARAGAAGQLRRRAPPPRVHGGRRAEPGPDHLRSRPDRRIAGLHAQPCRCQRDRHQRGVRGQHAA